MGLYEKITGCSYSVIRPLLEMWSRMEGNEGMWRGRIGHVADHVLSAAPYDIWLQAVSVGEVAVAEALIHALDKKMSGLKIIVSSSTPAGFGRAVSSLGSRCCVIPYPLDFPQVVRSITGRLRPRVYACLETELWPNFISSARRVGTRTVLLNGRISAASFPRYSKLCSIVRPMLAGFSQVCAISEVHARRLKALGANPDRIVITGNAKFEGLLEMSDPVKVSIIRDQLDLKDSDKVFVAGSIRSGEEKAMVSVCMDLLSYDPETVVFLVPRHMERMRSIGNVLRKNGVAFQFWSEFDCSGKRTANVMIVDVIGMLFHLYGLAEAAFVGGSLVPKGGQNLLEPAAWSCPVLYGPHTEHFEEARMALEQYGGGRTVRDSSELAEMVSRLFQQRPARNDMGARARSALESLAHGAATRQAETLLRELKS